MRRLGSPKLYVSWGPFRFNVSIIFLGALCASILVPLCASILGVLCASILVPRCSSILVALCSSILGVLCASILGALWASILKALCACMLGALCASMLGALCASMLGALCVSNKTYQFLAAHITQQDPWNLMIDNFLVNEPTTVTATNKHMYILYIYIHVKST